MIPLFIIMNGELPNVLKLIKYDICMEAHVRQLKKNKGES